MMNCDSSDKSVFEKAAIKDYLREFIPAMALVLILIFVIGFVVDFETAGNWKYLVALLPLLPIIFAARAVARNLGRSDEMGKQIQLEGMSAGFGAAMLATLGLAFLMMAGLDTGELGPWIVFGVGMTTWSFQTAAAARRLA